MLEPVHEESLQQWFLSSTMWMAKQQHLSSFLQLIQLILFFDDSLLLHSAGVHSHSAHLTLALFIPEVYPKVTLTSS
jgi:hypothetical protein